MCPPSAPDTDEQKQADPFALYAECGAVFPQRRRRRVSEPVPAREAGPRDRDPPGFRRITGCPTFARDRRDRGRGQLAAAAGDLEGRIRPRDFGGTAGAECQPDRSA